MSDPLELAAFAALLREPECPPVDTWKPVFVRLPAGADREFRALCAANGIRMKDQFERQLAELAEAAFPAQHDGIARSEVRSPAGVRDRSLGVWAYLPWLSLVVRILERADFFEVITNRNRDKVSRTEQMQLRERRVGVIGLSVGAEVAVTVAQEHLCGAIALADFDRLELSNLNRIGASIADLGENKARITARRIACIDPYIDVTIFEQGVNTGNARAFLGGLDLLIDECDDLPLKWDIRELALERGLDVVFAGDERGFLSVEPYSRRPAPVLFHGLVSKRPIPRVEYTDVRAYLRALTEWLGGWDALSIRSRSSLELVQVSLCGFPQLAGEARFAAAQVAHVARRLLLGEDVPPLAVHLDLHSLIRGSD